MSTRMQGKRKPRGSPRSSRITAASSYGLSGRRAEIRPSTLIGGFPDSSVVTLRYAQKLNLTSSSIPVDQVFRANGPYDPDYTGTGSQPNMWDNWTAVYNRYRVISSSIHVSGINTTSNAVLSVSAASVPSGGFSQDTLSRPRSQYRYLMSAAAEIRPMNLNYSTAQVLGLSDVEAQGAEVSSIYNTVPTNPWYWVVELSSFDNSTSVTASIEVIINYRVQFYDRIDFGLSLSDRVTRLVTERKVFLRDKVERKSEEQELKQLPLKSISSFAKDEYVEVSYPTTQAQPVRATALRTPQGAGDFSSALQRRH